MSLLVGITNARLSPTRRGIAVEIAARLAAATSAPVGLIGADPTDRDVQRHLPELMTAWGAPQRMQVERGPHQIELVAFARSDVCVVSVSDRESIELVLPELQQRFEYLVIDAPSRAGFGVGIAGIVLDWLDALVITTALGAGELAETRSYTEQLDALTAAQHVDVRVLAVGDASAGELAPNQLAARLAMVPLIGNVPRLGGNAAENEPPEEAALDTAFGPVISWIRTRQSATRGGSPAETDDGPAVSSHDHVANRLYREGVDT